MKELIAKFKGRRIAIVGDLMLDEFQVGPVERLSPEAPVPVGLNPLTELRMGGATNVAANVLSLGGECEVFGVVGPDESGAALISLLEVRGAGVRGVVVSSARPTTRKIRIMEGAHHIVRVDHEETSPIEAADRRELMRGLRDQLQLVGVDAFVLSDYGKGVITADVIDLVVALGAHYRVPVLADPKRDILKFKGVGVLKANVPGIRDLFLGVETDVGVVMAAQQLLDMLGAQAVVVTRGGKGLTVAVREGTRHFRGRLVAVSELTGAGDTVIAVLSLGLAAGGSVYQAAEIANAAASLVVTKAGTATVSPDELVEVSLLRAGARATDAAAQTLPAP